MNQLELIREKLRRVAQDPDVDDKKGTQPKKYYSGVKKSKKDARDAHFKKGASMSDDNPNAYKEAPGDRDEDGKLKKTKPSKHTNKFKQMYGEDGPCWDTHKQVGMKKKGGKMVPNCVPKNEASSPAQQAAIAIAKRKSGKYDKDGKRLDEKKKDMTAISTWKKNLKKVKGLSKDTMQQLSMLPTPVVTSLINQIGMIVAQYNEELEEETINEKFVRGVRDDQGMTALDRQVAAKKAEIARKRAEIKKREERAKAERKKKRLAKDRERVAQGKKKTMGTRVRNFFGRESYDVRKYMNLKKQLADLRVKADKAESGGRKDSLMGIQRRMDQIKDKMHKVKYEELGPNADAGDYIDDFRKSDAPQFKGKSDKKIRKMAIAAYLDSKEKK
tara:strand:- start:120 stop:1280 length:1161 start_codon:yes stop_codon:yes gene_type:complete